MALWAGNLIGKTDALISFTTAHNFTHQKAWFWWEIANLVRLGSECSTLAIFNMEGVCFNIRAGVGCKEFLHCVIAKIIFAQAKGHVLLGEW